jgi:serine/threonine protein kinase
MNFEGINVLLLSMTVDIAEALAELQSEFPDLVMPAENFTLGRMIGKGGFGEVFIALDRQRRKIALKRLFSERLEGRRIRRYLSEVRTLALCDSQFLVPFVGFTIRAPYYIITEFMVNGSLDRYIRCSKGASASFVCQLTPTQRTKIAMGIAHGVRQLHDHGIIHRDLKPGNILLADSWEPRVCDFGISRFKGKGEAEMTRRIGTPSFMAPEQVLESTYDNKVDVYAYSLILYEMSEFRRPFMGFKIMDVVREICQKQYRPDFSDLTPDPLRALISLCWSHDPAERPTFDKVWNSFASGRVSFKGTDPASIAAFVRRVDHEEHLREHVSDAEEDTEESDHKSDWRASLRSACESHLPAQVAGLLREYEKFTTWDRESQRYVLSQFSGLLKRGIAFVQEFVKAQFPDADASAAELPDDWVSLYKIVFQHCPRLIDGRHAAVLGRLLSARPHALLVMFSHVLAAGPGAAAFPVLELLLAAPESVADSPDGTLLLALLADLLQHTPAFAQAHGARATAAFSRMLRSTDAGTAAAAYAGAVHLQLPIALSPAVIAGHLRNRALWRPALLFLAARDTKIDEEVIRAVAVRAPLCRAAILVFLRLTSAPEMLRCLAVHRRWMSAAERWPIDTLRLALIVARTYPKPVVTYRLFPFVLRAAVDTRDPDVIAAIPPIIAICQDVGVSLKEFSAAGFLRHFHASAVATDRITELLDVAEAVADEGWIGELMGIMQTILRAVNSPLMEKALNVLLILARHRKGALKLKQIQFLRYCETLVNHPTCAAVARDLVQRLERSLDSRSQ